MEFQKRNHFELCGERVSTTVTQHTQFLCTQRVDDIVLFHASLHATHPKCVSSHLFFCFQLLFPSLSFVSPSQLPSLSLVELDLSYKALLKNPKCYSAWAHRLWVINLKHVDLLNEIKLCKKMLEMDARNCKKTTRQGQESVGGSG